MANKLLLIGIDTYESKSQLNNCVRDLIDFRDNLIEKYEFDENDVVELYDSEATNIKIQDAFRHYITNAEKTDNLLIYFSGHGEYDDATKTGYWVPYDGNGNYPTWISNDTLLSLLNLITVKHLFLISDSCFSAAILNIYPAKSTSEYNNRASRWGLASSFRESYDSKKGVNSIFADSIIKFLKLREKDFRVSELIESVKSSFATDVKQTPQGYPLMLSGHNGGEMLFAIKQESDQRKFKGYRDFEKTLQLYKRNSEFKKISIYEDRTNKIGFSLFQEYDSVKKKISFYLYLYEGIGQNKTLNYIKQHHKEIFKDRELIIFLSKERTQINLDARKNNIDKKFNPLSTFYIDDFIRLHCTPKFKREDTSSFLNMSNFVLPSYQAESNPDNIEQYIFDWFKKEDDPILVVIGTGGVGKTTFAQFVADKVKHINDNTFVMFIDSVLIKDSLLKRRKYFEEINLYNFYEALYELNDMYHEKLNEDLFRINLDAGNILLVIDGLDEVISKIPNFNVNLFLKSITDNSNEIGGGKVIITCRTHFWDNTDSSDGSFNIIELLPFSFDQTKRFFEMSFESDSSKVRRALKIADEFKYPETVNNFHPYVLDIIRSIISTDQQALSVDLSEFSSNILKSTVKNDYIIFRICDRERKRIGQISVDEQLSFFIYLATEKRGVIAVENFRTDLLVALDQRHVDKTNIEAFKAHPFLHLYDRTCRFRYDFLTDYFRGAYLTQFFEYKNIVVEPTDLFINLICENCWHGSPIVMDIVNRITHWNDDDILFINDIINKIANSNITEILRRKAIGNIFNVCLSINADKKTNGLEDNTNLLLSLFQSSKGKLENLSIININTVENKIRFDFSNLTIIQAYIDNFSSFWDCKMNELTFFTECHLLNLKNNRRSELSISQSNFHDCITDETVSSALTSNLENKIDKKGKAKMFLDDFFHLFLSNGRLERQSLEDVIETRFGGINKYAYSYKSVIKVLKNRSVITIYDNFRGSKIEVVSSHKEDVFRFVKDGTISRIISDLIEDIAKI